MEFLKETVAETKKIIDLSNDKLRDQLELTKADIIKHYESLGFIKMIKLDNNLSSLHIFDMACDFGGLWDQNQEDADENNVEELEIYSEFLLNELRSEASKIKNYIHTNLDIENIFYNGQGIILILTKDGFVWEDFDL